MFDTFEKSGSSGTPRLFAAGVVAVAGYAALAGLISFGLSITGANASDDAAEKKPEPPIEVAFRPPPPPPPPAPVAPPPPPPPRKPSAPRVARATPPPRPALAAPKEVPLKKPEEKESLPEALAAATTQEEEAPSDDAEGSGHWGGEAPDAPPAPAPSPVVAAKPVHLPENATPPVALDSNPAPEFPADARAKGLEGTVILRVVVSARGEVQRVEVLKGDEPFSTAALSAVQAWRYRPALSNGQPIAVFQTVRIPFRLRNS